MSLLRSLGRLVLCAAAALGQRASKDSADAFVYGILPPAKAVGRMAARRVAEAVADSLGSESSRKPQGGTSTSGFVGELAREIAQEYSADLKRGAEARLSSATLHSSRSIARRHRGE